MLKKIILFFKKNYAPILLIVLSCIVYNRFLFNTNLLFFDDFDFRYQAALKEYPLYPRSWLMNTNLGIPYIQKFMYPLDLLSGVLARNGLSWNIIERVLYFWPLIFLGPLFSYLFFKKILKSELGAVLGSVIFTYNSYFMVALYYGFFGVLMSQIFTPLFLLLFHQSLVKRNIRYSLVAGVSGLIITMYDFRSFYIIGLVCVVLAMLYLLSLDKNSIKKTIAQYWLYFLLPFLVTTILNSFWLLNFFIRYGDYSIALDRGLWSVWGYRLVNSLTLFHPYYIFGNIIEEGALKSLFDIKIYFWLVPFLAFCTLALNKKERKFYLIGLLTLLFIFISKQTSPPFSQTYEFLYNYIPGFNAFRESGKFYFIIALGYSLLVGLFIVYISKRGRGVIDKIITVFIVVVFSLSVYLNVKHLIFGVDPILKSKSIPEDYQVFNDYVLNQPEYFSILWLPYASKQWADEYSDNKPSLGLVSLIRDWHWKDFVSHNYKNGEFARREEVVNILNRQYSNGLLDVSSVKYVAIQLYDPELTESFIDLALMHGRRDYFYNTLQRLPYLKEINIGTSEISVFENEGFRPLLYKSDNVVSIYNNVTYENINYDFKNSTELEIHLRDVKKPFYLNFTQSYHPGWKVRVGEFSWFKSLFHKNYFQDQIVHIENSAKLNSYYIDPEKICVFSDCWRNGNGNYDLNLTLYFTPQSDVNVGLIISILSLGSIIVYFAVFLLGTFSKNKEYEH